MLPCKSILDAYEKSLDELISKRELVSDRLFPKTENISDALRWEKYHTLTQKCRIENEPCSNCQYYYGKHDIVCAVHTFGYEGDSCKDVEPNWGEKQLARNGRTAIAIIFTLAFIKRDKSRRFVAPSNFTAIGTEH